MITKKHIETSEDTKLEFDKFKGDISFKLKTRITSDKAEKILLNTYKDFQRLNAELQDYKEKSHALENHIQTLEA